MESSFPTVRFANAADKTAMVLVINAAFAIETFFDGACTDEERLAEMMTQGSFLLGHDRSGQLVASVYVELRGVRGYLGMLAVDPAYQGKGLGRAMVKSAEDYCRRQTCKAMDLTVLSLRRDLLPFYRKLGYVETGTEKFHPAHPLKARVECHCIVMSKSL